jgi:hypothetical protein
MPELKNKPPMPSWHGTPPDLTTQYVEFMRNNANVLLAAQQTHIEDAIRDAEYHKRDSLTGARMLRESIGQRRARLVELSASLEDTTDLSRYDESLAAVIAHPSVIGIRADSGGRLITHVRLFKKIDETDAYVGDFEIALYVTLTGVRSEQLTIAQTDLGPDERWSYGFDETRSQDGIVFGYLTSHYPVFQPLLQSGDFVGLIDAAIQRITFQAYTKRDQRQAEEPREPTWTGTMSDIETALRRTLEWSVNSVIREQIRKEETCIADERRRASDRADSVRTYNLTLSRLRAELEDAKRAIATSSFDEEAALEQLRYITTLPGVMGVRFIDNEPYTGKIPVFHVRTSMIYYGERYDMGDYEIEFRARTGAAVVRVNQTREVNRRKGTYYHPGSGCACCDNGNWFCFGDRATELRKLFERGEYGEFMHIAINTLNSVNSGDLYSVVERLAKIDMDAIWTPVLATVHPRRRRIANFLGSTVLGSTVE